MKTKVFIFAAALFSGMGLYAQDIELPKPDFTQYSKPMITTLQERHSVREYSPDPLSMEELSTLCWAACGMSRDENHITSPTAMNRQEIRLFVFTEKGVFEYLPKKNALRPVSEKDARGLFVSNAAPLKDRTEIKSKKVRKEKNGKTEAALHHPASDVRRAGQTFVLDAPVTLLMVIDLERFGRNDEYARMMGYIDAGIVSENINLYCESVKLATVPRVTMDVSALRQLLNLNENQIPAVNNPVGRPRQ